MVADHGLRRVRRTYHDDVAVPPELVLWGRSREREELERASDCVRGGESAVLVIRGEAGIGKTELMRYCAARATDCRVAQIAGIEGELELPFAALHQLCAPLLTDLPPLPEPQERALRIALGLVDGRAPDQFLVGLAVLSSLAEVAAKQPLVCLIDDAQWLDEVSSRVLRFVARRLLAESVLLVFAIREAPDVRAFGELPTLTLEGLNRDDARDLLNAIVSVQLDAKVRDRIVAETGGNPLALLEVPRLMAAAELAGGFGVPPTAAAGQLQDLYIRCFNALPEPTRQLMLLAATDPTGDATLVWRAAQTLGITRDAAAAAAEKDLLDIRSRVRFRHPLVRSAVQAAASPAERRAAHLAIASATDAETDPDRRVWHLASAAAEPDEELAGELERSADRAQGRAGLAAAAAFLERSASLTPDRKLRADRILAAAHAHQHAGAFDVARGLLAEAEATAVDERQGALVDVLRGQIDRAAGTSAEAPARLLRAAQRLEPHDARLARDAYLDAAVASMVAGSLAGPGGRLIDVALAVPRAASGSEPGDYMLEGLVQYATLGPSTAAPTLRRGVDACLHGELSPDQWLHWGGLASMGALDLGDYETWAKVSARQADVARSSGALGPLVVAVSLERLVATVAGDLDRATSLGVEEDALKDATGSNRTPYGALLAAGYRGRPDPAARLLTTTAEEASARGEGLGRQLADLATAILNNGLGRYSVALPAALRASQETYAAWARWALGELIEAAVHSGKPELADGALQRLRDLTMEDSHWSAAVEARSKALLSKGAAAESCYLDSIDHFARTPLRPELARTHLLYGEWLRRADRRLDARDQLRTAHALLTDIGTEAFAERARHELLAVGDSVRRRKPESHHDLTAQELHIARLARTGRTNAEIGEELFLSARTVEWHLRKVFTKLQITSRKDLQDTLPSRSKQL
ncbi:regulatory LuxR family protein [Kribbella rubisoli]|uniref:Regulatory LuxR family protein n=1 Tax=Kribbella rubisoli TaxID=3075929 RepID=A0A4Q7VZ93_9ACTN|nr:regulatory LuxR family protein [Kribbella rubisoli]